MSDLTKSGEAGVDLRLRVLVRAAALGLTVCLLAAACSGDPSSAPTPSGDASSSASMTGAAVPSSASSPSSSPAVSRPEGPQADVSQRLTGGRGVFLGSATPNVLGPGYVEDEYVATGLATAYRSVGALSSDGRWTFQPTGRARYRTRIVVRRPAVATTASGIVLVEWLNVSGGLDADAEYQTMKDEIVREGYTWVGVSAQKIGVEGGAVAVTTHIPGVDQVAGKGLKAIDPARYGSLMHPGDRFSFDIMTQVARALRAGGPVTGGVVPDRVLALGDSQSAFGLTTYINGVQPLTHAFDGFFVQSRAGSSMVMPKGSDAADVTATIFGPPTTFRTDTDVPIFDLQSETDVVGILGSWAARQPDTDLIRTWEVAGTAHADLHLVGRATAASFDCGAPINDGPLHVVADAALEHFVTWVTAGTPPPTGEPIQFSSAGAPRDADGLVLGGVRTPPVEVPVRVLSGAPGRDDEPLCLLFGSTLPLPAGRLAALYASRAEYLRRYTSAVDATVAAGFALPQDRRALMSYAHAELVHR